MTFVNMVRSLLISSILIGSFCSGFFFYFFKYPCVDLSILTQSQKGEPSILYDESGFEWGRFCYEKCEPVSLQCMPNHLLQAFIAAEDWNFYYHYGLSWRSMVRSLWVNLRHGRIVQGASTITQQLVKMLFCDNKRTFRRKLKEQILTLLIERQFTKEHILEMYVNHVYFGSGMYGVAAASKRFWGILVRDLSIDQSATLAAIICSPRHYSPLIFPYSAWTRRNAILSKMERLNFISHEQCEQLCKKPLVINQLSSDKCAPHAQEYIRTFLEEKFGRRALYTGGLVIQTTLNKQKQEAAQKAFSEHLNKLKKRYGADLEGALLSIDKKTGEIRALVGGAHFEESHFNRALYARRQQGSVFKPLLYAAALEKGVSFIDTAVDEPIKVHQDCSIWEPRNYTRTFEGKMTLARALSYSNNIISAKVILFIGAESVAVLARKCRLQGPIFPYPSLALGCLDSTLIEVTGMFNVFANEGIYCKPYLISWVKDAQGICLYKHQDEQERVISHRIASQVGQVLTIGLERKKRHAQVWIDSNAMSKTGTTNDSRTCWFAGSTPELTTVVYVGCDDNRPMGKQVFPLHTAYPIWLSYHLQVPTMCKEFTFDPTLKEKLVDWGTGEIVSQKQDGKEIHALLL